MEWAGYDASMYEDEGSWATIEAFTILRRRVGSFLGRGLRCLPKSRAVVSAGGVQRRTPQISKQSAQIKDLKQEYGLSVTRIANSLKSLSRLGLQWWHCGYLVSQRSVNGLDEDPGRP